MNNFSKPLLEWNWSGICSTCRGEDRLYTQESESFSFLSVHVVLYLAFAGFSTGHALGYVWQYDNKNTDISVFFVIYSLGAMKVCGTSFNLSNILQLYVKSITVKCISLPRVL